MKINKSLIVIAISSIILGIITQISYAKQSITVVPNQTYSLSGMTGETFEFSLDTANYVYASDASGSPLTVNNWAYPGFGQWTGGVYTRQWIPDIVTAPGIYVVSVSGYYMRKGPGTGEAKWIYFSSSVNNTVIRPHIQITANPSSVIADGSSTSILTAKILDKDNKVMTSRTDSITFTLSNPSLGNITSTNPVNAVAGIATATFQSGTQVAQDPPLTIKATSPNITEGSVNIIIDPKLDHVVIEGSNYVAQGQSATYTARAYDINNNEWSYGNLSYKWYVDGSETATTIPSQLSYPTDTNAFDTLGTHSISVIVTYKTQSKSTDRTITVVKVEMKSVKFTSDHGVLKDNNSDWADTGTTYTEPEWIKSSSTNNPITHAKNTTLVVEVILRVEPSGVAFDLMGDSTDNYVDFIKVGNISTGSEQAITAVSASAVLPNNVTILSKSITWKIKGPTADSNTEITLDTSGPHKIYVTYGTPSGSVVTEKRMAWDCSTANGQSTLQGIADAIYNDFETPPPYFQLGADAPNPLWLLMEGSQYKGECIDQANLMKLAIELLGGTASIGFVYGSTDTDCYSTSSTAHESRICPGGEHGNEKIYVYAGGGWNNWEAVCVASSKYYAIQIYTNTVPVEILRYWLGNNQPTGNHQAWIDSGICENPGPYPVPKP